MGKITKKICNFAFVMTKKNLLPILVATLLLLSCSPSGMKHGQLMGGIRPAQQQEQADNGAADTKPEAKAPADEPVGLEIPSDTVSKTSVVLHREGYTCSFNLRRGVPNWVAWKLTADHVNGPYKRKGIPFSPDPNVEDSPDTYDYMQSGYDRGHQCPSADNRWSQKAQEECFYMTNICPQNHQLNSGDWSELENKCRNWAKGHGAVYIVCGPIFYRHKPKTIGKHKVWVPDAFFKVVLTTDGTPKACGFIYKNTEGNRPMGDYVNSVDQVERITGLDFFSSLPDDVEKAVESKATMPD